MDDEFDTDGPIDLDKWTWVDKVRNGQTAFANKSGGKLEFGFDVPEGSNYRHSMLIQPIENEPFEVITRASFDGPWNAFNTMGLAVVNANNNYAHIDATLVCRDQGLAWFHHNGWGSLNVFFEDSYTAWRSTNYLYLRQVFDGTQIKCYASTTGRMWTFGKAYDVASIGGITHIGLKQKSNSGDRLFLGLYDFFRVTQ